MLIAGDFRSGSPQHSQNAHIGLKVPGVTPNVLSARLSVMPTRLDLGAIRTMPVGSEAKAHQWLAETGCRTLRIWVWRLAV